ncbi:DExH-box ATP-dependent RNA helicase DExH14 [Dictyocoela muelleri]|nr:DExH-box ATP-dependent RNA helicase DExH14 [Dictyocoela muelleri]
MSNSQLIDKIINDLSQNLKIEPTQLRELLINATNSNNPEEELINILGYDNFDQAAFILKNKIFLISDRFVDKGYVEYFIPPKPILDVNDYINDNNNSINDNDNSFNYNSINDNDNSFNDYINDDSINLFNINDNNVGSCIKNEDINNKNSIKNEYNEKLKALKVPQKLKKYFSYSHFNLVQSQVYSTAFHTNDNFLLTAPTGSGKTDVAIMTIIKSLIESKKLNKSLSESKKYNKSLSESKKYNKTLSETKGIIIYVVPMKALASEITNKLKNKLNKTEIDEFNTETSINKKTNNKNDYQNIITVEEYTGDTELTSEQIRKTDIIVCTPEKLDVSTRRLSNVFEKRIKLIIFDEIHMIQDDRGPVIEALVTRILRIGEIRQEFIRIVGLSATLPNYNDIGLFIRANKIFKFGDEYRSVPLAVTLIGADYNQFKNIVIEKIYYKNKNNNKINNKINNNKNDYKTSNKINDSKSTLIFVNSRSETLKFAQILFDEKKHFKDENKNTDENDIKNKNNPINPKNPNNKNDNSKNKIEDIENNNRYNKNLDEGEFRTKKIDKYLKDLKNTSQFNQLKSLILAGIGIHHAGLPRKARIVMETLFKERIINVLICTTTLAWGVNLPAENVIIKGTKFYNQDKGCFSEMGILDILQIFGRAGRPQFRLVSNQNTTYNNKNNNDDKDEYKNNNSKDKYKNDDYSKDEYKNNNDGKDEYTNDGFNKFNNYNKNKDINKKTNHCQQITPQIDNYIGNAILITTKDQLPNYVSLLKNQSPIESKMLNHLCDQLNAEINISIYTFLEALNWLKNTFLYIRMKKNPFYYGIQPFENIDVLEEYVFMALKRLEDCRLIDIQSIDKKSFNNDEIFEKSFDNTKGFDNDIDLDSTENFDNDIDLDKTENFDNNKDFDNTKVFDNNNYDKMINNNHDKKIKNDFVDMNEFLQIISKNKSEIKKELKEKSYDEKSYDEKSYDEKSYDEKSHESNIYRLTFTPTFYGKIASIYYLHHLTINEWLNSTPIDEYSILILILKATEFKNIILRDDELLTLENLCENLGVENLFVKNENIDFKKDKDKNYKKDKDKNYKKDKNKNFKKDKNKNFKKDIININDNKIEINDIDLRIYKLYILIISFINKIHINSFSLSCDTSYIIKNIKRLLTAYERISIFDKNYKNFILTYKIRKLIEKSEFENNQYKNYKDYNSYKDYNQYNQYKNYNSYKDYNLNNYNHELIFNLSKIINFIENDEKFNYYKNENKNIICKRINSTWVYLKIDFINNKEKYDNDNNNEYKCNNEYNNNDYNNNEYINNEYIIICNKNKKLIYIEKIKHNGHYFKSEENFFLLIGNKIYEILPDEFDENEKFYLFGIHECFRTQWNILDEFKAKCKCFYDYKNYKNNYNKKNYIDNDNKNNYNNNYINIDNHIEDIDNHFDIDNHINMDQEFIRLKSLKCIQVISDSSKELSKTITFKISRDILEIINKSKEKNIFNEIKQNNFTLLNKNIIIICSSKIDTYNTFEDLRRLYLIHDYGTNTIELAYKIEFFKRSFDYNVKNNKINDDNDGDKINANNNINDYNNNINQNNNAEMKILVANYSDLKYLKNDFENILFKGLNSKPLIEIFNFCRNKNLIIYDDFEVIEFLKDLFID